MAKMKVRPEMGPGELSVRAESGTTSAPSEMPPAGMVSSVSAGETLTVVAETVGAAPTLPISEGGAGEDIAVWQTSKKFTALWCINQNRNVYVGVQGIGWKKLADNSDSAVVALTMLSAHAYEKGSIVNYRDESDNKIHEMYVW